MGIDCILQIATTSLIGIVRSCSIVHGLDFLIRFQNRRLLYWAKGMRTLGEEAVHPRALLDEVVLPTSRYSRREVAKCMEDSDGATSVADPLLHVPNLIGHLLLGYYIRILGRPVRLLRRRDGVEHNYSRHRLRHHLQCPILRRKDIDKLELIGVESELGNVRIEQRRIRFEGEPPPSVHSFLLVGHGGTQ